MAVTAKKVEFNNIPEANQQWSIQMKSVFTSNISISTILISTAAFLLLPATASAKIYKTHKTVNGKTTSGWSVVCTNRVQDYIPWEADLKDIVDVAESLCGKGNYGVDIDLHTTNFSTLQNQTKASKAIVLTPAKPETSGLRQVSPKTSRAISPVKRPIRLATIPYGNGKYSKVSTSAGKMYSIKCKSGVSFLMSADSTTSQIEGEIDSSCGTP